MYDGMGLKQIHWGEGGGNQPLNELLERHKANPISSGFVNAWFTVCFETMPPGVDTQTDARVLGASG